jgi:acyl dehydratase
MPKRYFEDFQPGLVMEFGPRLVTRDEIVAFAAEFDPQPMHMDEEAGRASMLRGLGGSGFHTCCLMMRMITDGFLLDSSSMGAPGIDEIKWLSPLRPDSRITVRATVLETKASRSKPDRGFIKFHYEVLDGTKAAIMTLACSMMMGTRG